MRNAGLADMSDDWSWWLIFVATLAWAVVLVFRPPTRYGVPGFMRRLDGAYLEGQDAKVLDYWRAAGWLAFLLLTFVAFLLVHGRS